MAFLKEAKAKTKPDILSVAAVLATYLHLHEKVHTLYKQTTRLFNTGATVMQLCASCTSCTKPILILTSYKNQIID